MILDYIYRSYIETLFIFEYNKNCHLYMQLQATMKGSKKVDHTIKVYIYNLYNHAIGHCV